MSYRRAMPVIDAVKSSVTEYRCDEKFDGFIKKAQQLIPESLEISQAARRTRRNQQIWTILLSKIALVSAQAVPQG